MKPIFARSPLSLGMLALSLVCGLLVSCVSYLCAWWLYGGLVAAFENGHLSRLSEIRQLDALIQQHQEVVGQYPDRLQELMICEDPGVKRNGAGAYTDVDGNEYYYQRSGDTYTLLWLGLDNQLGGEGPNADLSPQGRKVSRPSLWEFTFDLRSSGIRVTCIIAGLVTVILTFRSSRRTLDRRTLVGELIVTLIVTIMVALIIAIIHIPNGH